MEILTAKQKKNLSRITTVRVHGDVDIHVICQRMSNQGEIFNLRQISVFNGITIISSPGMTENQIYQAWRVESQARREKRQNSFRAEAERRRLAVKESWRSANRERILQLLKKEKIRVPLRKRLEFNRVVKLQSRKEYGRAVLAFAFAFAALMQQALKEGKKFENVAEQLGKEADYMLIAGAQSEIAMKFLVKYWRHGKELDHWLLIK